MARKSPGSTPIIYKTVAPIFIVALAIMIYGILLGDFSISTTGVLIMLVLYFILKSKSPNKM